MSDWKRAQRLANGFVCARFTARLNELAERFLPVASDSRTAITSA